MYGIMGMLIGYLITKSIFGGIFGYLIGFFLSKNAKSYSRHFSQQEINNGNFEINLLILSAFIIKSDGKVSNEELLYVRKYFIKVYGENYANKIFSDFKQIIKDTTVSLEEVCISLNRIMTYPMKLQVIHYLFGISKSDGNISREEIYTINSISNYLNININDFYSIKYMFIHEKYENDLYVAYKILELNENSTIEEIKESYRKLAKLHHPDRVQHLGEKYVKGAKEKFTEIQNAYEKIKNAKNF